MRSAAVSALVLVVLGSDTLFLHSELQLVAVVIRNPSDWPVVNTLTAPGAKQTRVCFYIGCLCDSLMAQ